MVKPPSKPVVPFEFQVLYLVLSGTISTTQSWSVGVHIIHDNSDEAPSAANLGSMLSAYDSAIQSWGLACAPTWSTLTVLTTATLSSYVPTSGKAHTTSKLRLTAVGGGSGSVMPSQVSIVATKHSNLSGESAMGRWYQPGTGLSLTAAYQVTQGTCDLLAEATGSLFTAINQTNGTAQGLHNLACVIASRTTQTFHPIDEVTVDSRADVQRRRGDKIHPQFLGQAAVAG